MNLIPVIRAATGGLLRRRLVQTVVICVVLMAATAAATLGLTLVTSANEGFLNAFTAHHGADLAVSIDSGRVSRAQLAATRRAAGVTQLAGPYPEASATVQISGAAGTAPPGGGGNRPASGNAGAQRAGGGPAVTTLEVVGRTSRGGPLDDLTLSSGHWPTGPGQIILAVYQPFQAPVGAKVTVTSAPGKPPLTVVGYAGSQARLGDAWVAPGEIAALRPAGTPATVQMLYTFRRAASAPQLNADLTALKAALPAGAVTGYQSWLAAADQTGAEQGINTPFVVAFAVLALVLSVLIVANVVSAAVVAAYRRIGVLKSIGFSPAQVTTAYVAQVGGPALAGCAAGVWLGNDWVLPLLGQGRTPGGTADTVPLWINIAVPLAMCALTGLAALVPALRAGRLSAVAAIAAGQAPRAGQGYAAHRLLSRVALPRPVTIGLAAPFARPARSAATAAAIVFGVTAVILAVGLDSSLAQAGQVQSRGYGQVDAGPAGGGPELKLTASQDRQVAAVLAAQPGTLRYVAEASTTSGTGQGSLAAAGGRPVISAPGMQLPLAVMAYRGDSGWLHWDMISGHWYGGQDEAVVNTSFLTQTGLSVGDRFRLTVNGKAVTVRITGQVFLPNVPYLITSYQTLGGAAGGLAPSSYDVGLRPGVRPRAYAAALGRALGPGFSVFLPQAGGSITGFADTSLIRLLTLIVAVLAGLGVLNSVLMVTRERVHDLGVFKAVGMTPRQTIAMVVCWVIAPAVTAAAIALPAAVVAHSVTLQAIGGEVGTAFPADVVGIYRPGELLLLALSGLVIAAAGALLPAGWAAASRTTAALHAE